MKIELRRSIDVIRWFMVSQGLPNSSNQLLIFSYSPVFLSFSSILFINRNHFLVRGEKHLRTMSIFVWSMQSTNQLCLRTRLVGACGFKSRVRQPYKLVQLDHMCLKSCMLWRMQGLDGFCIGASRFLTTCTLKHMPQNSCVYWNILARSTSFKNCMCYQARLVWSICPFETRMIRAHLPQMMCGSFLNHFEKRIKDLVEYMSSLGCGSFREKSSIELFNCYE